ncbi:hypothetical protein AB1Y20_016345 [Prymnesium parvum]|uniref:PGG domain-containing protein n=1 Tax=Prymnesium parvum TaxID=97485 RepID=A0AB34ICH5_PRYPA
MGFGSGSSGGGARAPMSTGDREGELSAVAKANAASPLIKELGLFDLIKVLVANEWMTIGNTFGSTEDAQSRATDVLLNVGVVTALIFTMTSIAPEDVGEELELNYSIDARTAQNIYTFLASGALVVMMVGVMMSMNYYVVVSQCNNNDEALHLIHDIKRMLSLPYFLLILGLILYVMSQMWLAASLMSPAYFWVFFGSSLLLFALAALGLCIVVKALYRAKYRVGQGWVAQKIV